MSDALLTREAAEAPAVAERQRVENAAIMADLATRLRTLKPAYVATCARGSSDHAATYGKYLIERVLGLPVASLGPSLASVYQGEVQLSGALFLAISQSGRSPDILRLAESAKRAGALVVGLVNDETSPLAGFVDVLVPLRAGSERSVAATKSFLGTCTALLQLVAAWSGKPTWRARWSRRRASCARPATVTGATNCWRSSRRKASMSSGVASDSASPRKWR
jgi:glucosamine--fructose-6-phosphate aminotransferase (isomerizing)